MTKREETPVIRTSRHLAPILMVFFLLLASPFAGSASAQVVHTFEGSFGSAGSGDGQLVLASTLVESGVEGRSGLAVNDETHDVYVADTGNHRVVEFSSSGAFIRAFGADVGGAGVDVCTSGCAAGTSTSSPGGFEAPTFIAVDNAALSPSKGDVYVADVADRLVSKFDAEGNLISSWGVNGQLNGSAASGGPFTFVTGIAVDSSGDLNVYDGKKNNWFIFTPEGAPKATVGMERGFFPSGIAVDTEGHFYKVVGFGDVTEFAAAGTQMGDLEPGSELNPSSGLAIDTADNTLYVDREGTHIAHYAASCTSGSAGYPCHPADSFGEAQLTKGGGVAVDSDGAVYVAETATSTIDAFEPIVIPDVSTETAEELEQHIATVHGHVDPAGGGEVTSCRFAYGTSTSYGQTQPCSPATPYAGPQGTSASLTGLAPDTTYHYRIEAANANGVFNSGEDATFTTTGPPLVKGASVSNIEPTTATLHATLNPSGYATTYHFEYGKTVAYGSETGTEPVPSSGHEDQAVQAALSGLELETAYHFRAVAESECEPVANPGHVCVTAGPDQTFETLPAVSVADFTTQTVGPELVTLKAELDNNASLTTGHYTFRLGEDTNYATGKVEGTLAAGSSSFEKVEATFTGLQPHTVYHYQLVAENEYGQLETADAEFTTEPSTAEERAGESCPNTLLREENNSLALADCRAYEQVSPAFKAGYGVDGFPELAPTGNSALFGSDGAFSGTSAVGSLLLEYVSRRTPAGWETEPVLAFPAGPDQQPVSPFLYDPGLEHWLFEVAPGHTTGQSGNTQSSLTFFAGAAGGAFSPAFPPLNLLDGPQGVNWAEVLATSSDFSRAFLITGQRLLASDLLGSTREKKNRIYELNATGSGPALRLVVELPQDLADGSAEVFESCRLDESTARVGRWASADGSTLFYTAPLDTHPGQACEAGFGSGGPNKGELFARSGEAAPVQVSAPFQCTPPSPCAAAATAEAFYAGASPAGRLAWFTTQQPLVNSDLDPSENGGANDLYLARLSQSGQLESLVQASAGAASDPHQGEGAGVQGVVSLSEDGTHVAFVASGVLTTQPDAALPPGRNSAAQGADNLYVYDATSGETKFVARLCSGPEASGSVREPACDASLHAGGSTSGGKNDQALWEPASSVREGSEDQLTPNGGFLVFASYGRLSGDDADAQKSIYRFDFAAGALNRVSIGRDGNDGNGNDNAFAASLPRLHDQTAHANGGSSSIGLSVDAVAEDGSRAISSDGSTVVFTTAAPLVSRDTNAGPRPGCGRFNTGCDVYEWEQAGHGSCPASEAAGCISLVSDGVDVHAGEPHAIISSSGGDVTFQTSSGLLAADTDGVTDLYDARANGGFPPAPGAEPCRSAETCHGEGSGGTTHVNPVTESLQSGGNGRAELECAKGKHKAKKHGQVRCVANKPHKRHGKHHHRAAGKKQGGKK